MVPALKSEIRKLLTVRSTYVITGLAVLLAIGVNFYIAAFKTTDPVASDALQKGVVMGTLNGVSIFVAIISLLLVTHEYRYNTIYYSLTSARSRTQVMLAKVLVFTLYAVKFTVLISLVSVAAMLIGLKVGDHHLTAQHIDWWGMTWRSLYYVWGLAAFAAMIGFLVRNQVGAIVAYFIGINTVEGLLTMVLKEKAAYLPFTSLGNVLTSYNPTTATSIGKAALISGTWLTVGWLIAWVLFVRRDAN